MKRTMPVLERILEPIGHCFNRKAAEAIVRLRADPEAQARIDELADKCNEGTFTADERAEYEACISASNVIAILQSKARSFLARSKRK